MARLLYAGSQLKQNEAALSIKCKVCLQPFICTSAEVKLREHRRVCGGGVTAMFVALLSPLPNSHVRFSLHGHSDNKHPKQTFADCFPDYKPPATK